MRERRPLPKHTPGQREERPRAPATNVDAILALQRSAGNIAVQRALAGRRRRVTRVLDTNLVGRMQGGRDDLRQPDNLAALVAAYNDACPGDDSQASLDARMSALDAVEHLIYVWFENVRGTLNPDEPSVRTDPTLRAMFDLMNAVQSEHKTLIDKIAKTGAKLWAFDNPQDAARNDLDGLWADIVSGTGPFTYPAKINTTMGTKDIKPQALEAFKLDIMASFARLISRPKGRALVMELRRGNLNTEAHSKIDFAMSALYKLTAVKDYGSEEPYVGAKAASSGPSFSSPKETETGIVAGAGAPSGVEVAPGVRDASLMDKGAPGTFVPSPTFLGLGHELIHAAHYLRGSYVGGKPAGEGPKNLPESYGGDVEEFLTIAPTSERQPFGATPYAKESKGTIGDLEQMNAGLPSEADLRAEHGLGIRQSHEGLANPFLFPGAIGAPEPGRYVQDVLNWLEENWPVEGGRAEAATLDQRLHPDATVADTTPTTAPVTTTPTESSWTFNNIVGWFGSFLPSKK